jgi:hypothetical protein
MITADDPIITDALKTWHDAERGEFMRRGYVNLDYDKYTHKHAHTGGKRWLRLDRDTSGVYLIDKLSATLDVYTIKGYGVPNRRIGTLTEMMARWVEMAARTVSV